MGAGRGRQQDLRQLLPVIFFSVSVFVQDRKPPDSEVGMEVGNGACKPVQKAGAVVTKFLRDLAADEGNGVAAAGAGFGEGLEADSVGGKVQAKDFGQAWRRLVCG